MELKFKVGDSVVIRQDLEVREYAMDAVVDPMLQYRGQKAMIVDIVFVSGYKGEYAAHVLDIDDGNWWWTEDMLVAEKEIGTNDSLQSRN